MTTRRLSQNVFLLPLIVSLLACNNSSESGLSGQLSGEDDGVLDNDGKNRKDDSDDDDVAVDTDEDSNKSDGDSYDTDSDIKDEKDDHLYNNCLATGDSPLIDDMEDGDNAILPNSDRIGYWFTFNPGNGCQQTPVVDASNVFTMESQGANGSYFCAATTGTTCQASWTGGGIGFEFMTAPSPSSQPIACSNGYNASVYDGISFDIKTSQAVRVQVCTKSVTDYNCHGYP